VRARTKEEGDERREGTRAYSQPIPGLRAVSMYLGSLVLYVGLDRGHACRKDEIRSESYRKPKNKVQTD
jgi:hypothetical protein